MDDDLKDVDQELIEGILENADAFIGVDETIDSIVESGQREIDAVAQRIAENGGTLEDFKNEAARIRSNVESKLKALEDDLRQRYGGDGQ